MNLRKKHFLAPVVVATAVIAVTGPTSVARAGTGNVVLTPHHGYNLTAVDHNGLPKNLTDGSLSYDHNGEGHFVGLKNHHLVYLIHQAGGKGWQKEHFAGHTTLKGGGDTVITRMSNNGHVLSIVAAACGSDGIYGDMAGAAAHRPEIVRALPRDVFRCHGDDDGVSLAGAAFSRRTTLVFNNLDEPGLPTHAVTVTTGGAGAAFPTPTQLPDPDHLVTDAVGATYSSGYTAVIGVGPAGVYEWLQPLDEAWSGPTLIAASNATYRYSAELGPSTVTSADGHVYVGIVRVTKSDPVNDRRPGVLTGTSNGQWATPATIRGGIGQGAASVAVDPTNGELHTAYVAQNPGAKHRRLAVSLFTQAHWTKPVIIAKGDADVIDQVLVTPGHNTAVGFRSS